MTNYTTTTPTVPDVGYVRICTAATACPVTVVDADAGVSLRLMNDHLLDSHGPRRTGEQP